jgi:hypothetical protein
MWARPPGPSRPRQEAEGLGIAGPTCTPLAQSGSTDVIHIYAEKGKGRVTCINQNSKLLSDSAESRPRPSSAADPQFLLASYLSCVLSQPFQSLLVLTHHHMCTMQDVQAMTKNSHERGLHAYLCTTQTKPCKMTTPPIPSCLKDSPKPYRRLGIASPP